MKESQTGHAQQSKAAAHSVGKDGIGFSPPQYGAPVFQRVGEAKSSIQQPDKADQSAEVPDLPKAITDVLTEAKNDKTKRQEALDALLQYLKDQNIIEVRPKLKDDEDPQPELAVFIQYLDNQGRGKLAYKQYFGGGKQPHVTINVHASLFDKSLPVIYSTIRHELIHAAQDTQQADDQTSSSDEYIFGISDDVANHKKLTEKLIANLQEIETHVWELNHASETGINSDANYIKETEDYLKTYTNKAIEFINAPGTKAMLIQQDFSGYIRKAIAHLRSAPNKIGDPLADALQEALDKKKPTASERVSGKKSSSTPDPSVGGPKGISKKKH